MRIDILTLFPEVFDGYFGASIIGRASAAGIVDIRYTNFRDFTSDKHRSVDDKPFGGGPGMVMMCSPVFEAVESVRQEAESGESGEELILLTPQGERFSQPMAESFASRDRLILICGHYEGFDDRIREGLQPREVSIGDYVLSGGESAAMVLVDAVVRLLPGALGHEESTADESFSHGLLEYPQYTRPREFRGMTVPDVLVSGHHAEVEAWRRRQALERTKCRRPDLLSGEAERSTR